MKFHWCGDPAEAIHGARSLLSFDTMLVGVLSPRRLLPESFLLEMGVDRGLLKRWCELEHRHDPLWQDVRRKGRAEGRRLKTQPGPPLPGPQQVMLHTLPASLDGQRLWYLAVGRKHTPFKESEHRKAALYLRLTQMAFDMPDEPGLGRLLLDRDYRLIHADPLSEDHIAERPGSLRELAVLVPSVIRQRWPELSDCTTHDMALEVGGKPTWVRFRQNRVVDEPNARSLYLELRQLGNDESPVVGRVDDARIALALGYLSDRFAMAPSLSEVASVVRISPFHFHRLFSRCVGVSPKHYLLRMQLQIAKWMVRSTRIPVGEIAASTGFASHGHFTATFHRLVGVSPSTYRERS